MRKLCIPRCCVLIYMYIYIYVHIDERGGHDDDDDVDVATTAMATLVMRTRLVLVRSLLTLVEDNVESVANADVNDGYNAEWIRDRCLYVVCAVLEQNIRASDSNPWCGPTWSPTNTDFEGAPISQQVISHSRFDLCSCSVARISFHCDDTFRSRSVPGHRLRAWGGSLRRQRGDGQPVWRPSSAA